MLAIKLKIKQLKHDIVYNFVLLHYHLTQSFKIKIISLKII